MTSNEDMGVNADQPQVAVATTETPAAAPPPEPTTITTQTKRPRWVMIGLLAGLAITLAVCLLRLDQAVGNFFADDAYYVVLAKSLASGQGYRLINSPSGTLMPLYPPGFPALLAIAYRLGPEFPQNVWLLKLVSILALLLTGWLAYRYFARERGVSEPLALGIALATALTPGLVFLATATVMSECVFTAALMGMLFTVERGARLSREGAGNAWRWLLLGGAISAFALLTRSAALALVAAAICYLLKERLWRGAALYAAMVLLLVGPWMLYARAHAPTAEQRREQQGYIVTDYTEQFWRVQADDANSGQITLAELPQRVLSNAFKIAEEDIERIILSPLTESMRRQTATRVKSGTGIISLILSLLMVIGFIAVCRARVTMGEFCLLFSLGMIVLWPWDTYRFVLPLTPLLIFYLVMGVRAIDRWRRRAPADAPALNLVPGVLLGLLLAVSLYGHVSSIQRLHFSTPLNPSRWLSNYAENRALLKWISDTLPPDEVLTAKNPPLVYLYTGRKTISAENLGDNQETLRRFKVRYLVYNSPVPIPNPDLRGGQYKIVHRVPGNLNLYVVDLGMP